MNSGYTRRQERKTPVGFWVMLAAAIALTVSLIIFLGVTLVFRVVPVSDSVREEQIYTQQDRWEYWRGFDATALASVITHVYPDAHSCILAEGADENFIAMTADTPEGQLKFHFSLRGANMTFYGGYPGYDRAFAYTSRVYEEVLNPGELARNYGDHLRDRGVAVTAFREADVDGDGRLEYVYLVNDLMDSWLMGGDGTDEQLRQCAALLDKTVCIYMDTRDASLYVHSFCLDQDPGSLDQVLWDNGMLHLNGQQRLFVSEPELCMENYGQDPDILQRLCARYTVWLEDRGFSDIRMARCDVSAAPGDEILCCYRDGGEYITTVYALMNGRFRSLYSKNGAAGSVFLVTRGGVQYLLDYSQSLGQDYSISYGYALLTFDEDYVCTESEKDSIWVAADQGGGYAGSEFFRRVNAYLEDAVVCYDPYGLTGYTLMQDGMDQQAAERYLNITNCSTNKTGIVTLQDDDSYLHLRTGPSTKDDIVLIDPNDEDSCVKQVKGSLVTVLMPVNTGNRDNPIWAQIRISYHNRSMIGYSSQRYIRIEGIRHLKVGQQFTVEVDNYTSELTWSSSDESVAYIDPVSGTVTANRSGLVLITVRSKAGLEDSCLIMVD